MKRFALVLWSLWLVGAVWAAKPEDRFLDAYFLIQDGDSAAQKSGWVTAQSNYLKALQLLQDIKGTAPDWNPHIIEFRISYCNDQLRKLQDKLPATSVPSPVTATNIAAAAAATAVAAGKRIDQLTTELSQAHEQIRSLEKSREELQTKLQAALNKVTPAETSMRIEELLQQHQKLSAQLAAAEQRIQDLSGQAEELQAAQKKIRDLEATRTELTAKLQSAEARTAQIQAESDSRVNELLKRNAQLTTELTTVQGQIAEIQKGQAGSAEQVAEIAKLRQQLAAAVTEMEHSQQELTTALLTLGGVRQELAGVRAENTQLRQSYGELEGKLKEADGKVATLGLGARKDDEIILYLRKENALLKEIASRRAAQAARQPAAVEPPARKQGFLWWSRPEVKAATPAAPAPKEAPPPKVKESASERLVAEITALPSPKAATAAAREEVPAMFQPTAADTQALLNEARTAVNAKDYATAIAKYRAVLETDPNNLLAFSNLGVAHYQQGNLDEAETSLRRAVAIAPNDSESRALLGIVYFRKSKLEEAFAELTRAIAINPRHAQAHNYLGITLSEKGWTAAAEQEIRKAVELDPRYADAHFNLAVLYAGLHTPRYELAKYHYQKALDLGAKADAALEAQIKKGESAPAK